MKKEKIEDIFSSMEDFSSVPPPELWSQIEEKLDKPKKKRRAVLWWSAAACLLLGLLLPSVLHFTSNSETKTTVPNVLDQNTIVLDQKDHERSIPAAFDAQTKEAELEKQLMNDSQVSSSEKTSNQSNQNQTQESVNAQTGSKLKNTFDSKKQQNHFNNSISAEKAIVSSQENKPDAVSKNQILNSKKGVSNQTVAEKSFSSAKGNAFDQTSKNQYNDSKTAKSNQVAAKSFVPNRSDSFNFDSKTQSADLEKRNTDKVLAEKTFSSGKKKTFNEASKNQFSNSVFEKVLNPKNNDALAFIPLTGNQNAAKSSIEKQTAQNAIESREMAGVVQKENSKSTSSFPNVNSINKKQDVLSHKDSIQLAELHNLEKGILTPEDKKNIEEKLAAKTDKWAVAVFAGINNSENYKNEKTLGSSNDSKQSNTYGVKTTYKISKKWAVGSGLKVNELGQSVANVSYLSARNFALIAPSNVYDSPAQPKQIVSSSEYLLISNTTKEAFKNDDVQSGNLDQSLRYIEMPLEVSYSVFNRNKATININTGGFVGKLISNNVALDGHSIGENISAKDYVYGSTLSSTLQYRVYKKTNVFVEPAMNYYINPLNSQSFNQFQWGLNFGLNVSF